MRATSLLGGSMLCLAAGGCGVEEPPHIRQLACVPPGPPDAAGPLIVSIDTGRRSATFVNRPGRPVRKAEIDRYGYRFALPGKGGDSSAEIGRMDGRMRIASPGAGDVWWSCKAMAAGPIV